MKKILGFAFLFFLVCSCVGLYAGCNSVPLTTSYFENSNLSEGYSYQGYGLINANDGLYMPAAPWKNGCQNNVCDGNYATTKEKFNFQNGGDLYVSLAADGGGKYMWFGASMEGLSYIPLSTDHSWSGSFVIADNLRLFLHLKLNSDKTYSWTVCSGDYDDNGGTVLTSVNKTLSDTEYEQLESSSVKIWLGDNYAGTDASMTVYEVKICIDSNGSTSCTSSDCEATYDLFSSTLTIPCFKINEKSYWLKMEYLQNDTFKLYDYGENN